MQTVGQKPRLYLRMFTALPGKRRTDRVDYNPEITSLSFSTQLQGATSGYNALKVGYDADPFYRPDGSIARVGAVAREVQIVGFGHVEVVAAGDQVVWEGRILRPMYQGSEIRGFDASGYSVTGLKDGVFTTSDMTKATGGGIVRRVLAAAAPAINVQQAGNTFVDPGNLHAFSEFNARAPAQVVDQVCKVGGSVNALFDLRVWNGQRAYLLPRTAPTDPTKSDYIVPLDPATVQLYCDYTDAYGSVMVQYTSIEQGGTRFITRTDPTFVARYGFFRQTLVQASTLTDAAAVQFAATWLAFHNGPVWSGKLTREWDRGLERPGGTEQPGYLVRSGEYVQLGIPDARHNPVPPLCIIRTQYDAHSGHFECDLNQSPPGDYAGLLQSLRNLGTAQVQRINPNTGAPLST